MKITTASSLDALKPTATRYVVRDSLVSGLELQSRLTTMGRHVPIIFVTAFPQERIRARALKAGAFGFLSKPFSDASLIACLDRALAEDDSEGVER